MSIGIERNDGNCEEGGGDDCTLAAPFLRERSKYDSAGDGAQAVKHTDEANGLGRKLDLHREEGGIHILRAMRKAHECRHENDEEEEGGQEADELPHDWRMI